MKLISIFFFKLRINRFIFGYASRILSNMIKINMYYFLSRVNIPASRIKSVRIILSGQLIATKIWIFWRE